MVIAQQRILPQSLYGKVASMAQGDTLPFLPACASLVRSIASFHEQ